MRPDHNPFLATPMAPNQIPKSMPTQVSMDVSDPILAKEGVKEMTPCALHENGNWVTEVSAKW